MADLPEAVASGLQSYFYFLLDALPRLKTPSGGNSHLILPAPSDGWPDVTSEKLAILGKSDAVLDVLRHLPKFKADSEGNNVLAPHGTGMRDYAEEAKSGNIHVEEWMGLPAHVVPLTYAGRDGNWWLLDTERG